MKIDEETLRRARIRALQQGTSVNAVVQEFLASYVRGDEEMEARRRLTILAGASTIEGHLDDRGWTREDLYEDRTHWPLS